MMPGLALFLVAILGAAMGEAMGHGLRRQLPLLLAFGGAFLLGLCLSTFFQRPSRRMVALDSGSSGASSSKSG